MSSARISPPGPEPVRREISTPFSWARRRAFGEIRAVPRAGEAGVGGAAAAATATGLRDPVRSGGPSFDRRAGPPGPPTGDADRRAGPSGPPTGDGDRRGGP